MPPRVRVTKEQILEAALQLVRRQGAEAINARAVAAEIGCSTQPIFSNFPSVDDLKTAVTERALNLYNACIRNEMESTRYPLYKATGMGYIRFAEEESRLFCMLFMGHTDRGFGKRAWNTAVDALVNSTSLSREKAQRFHLEMWVFVHGIAAMIATNYLTFEHEEISAMITDVYLGLRHRYLSDKGETV